VTTSIKIGSLDGGEFSAYLAEPAGKPTSAILLIQEIFGVNTGIRRKCDLLAQQGYLVLSPDMFWRLEPDLQLDSNIETSMNRALEMVYKFDENAAVRDIQATIFKAHELLAAAGKVGLVGYCLGGRLAYLAAARSDIDVAVGYYGVNIDLLLGEKDAIKRPLMLHMAGEDPFVDAAKQALIHQALDHHPQVTLFDYPGEHHGFARELGKNRSETAANTADKRTEAFLNEHLG
jgi:carboxymethylenebutenolidase